MIWLWDGRHILELTQRLVSALIEENIIAPIREQSSGSGSSDSATTRSGNNPPRTPTKAPHVPHTRTLEARVREELIFQGILDADDQADEEVDDEVYKYLGILELDRFKE